MPSIKLLSGGQQGVDLAALRAAKKLGLATGGAMPLGWLTEDGPRPEYAEMYGMTECQEAGHPARTKANAKAGMITLWLGPIGSPGYRSTKAACKTYGKPFIELDDLRPESADTAAKSVAMRLAFEHELLVLNVAGSRESKAPGIGEQAEAFLVAFLPALVKCRVMGSGEHNGEQIDG